MEFLTNEFKLEPGLIAFLYSRRWEEEKCFDTWKNDFSLAKPWGASVAAIENQVRLAMRSAAHGVLVAEAVAVRERTPIMTSYRRFIGFMPQPALTGDAAHPAGFAPLKGNGLGKE